MNTDPGYVLGNTADLLSTRHLTHATLCRTIYEMPFVMGQVEPSDSSIFPERKGIRAYRRAIHLAPSVD